MEVEIISNNYSSDESIETVTLISDEFYFNEIEEIDENYSDYNKIIDKIENKEIISKNKINCLNFMICKNTAKVNKKFCSECFLYFNLKLTCIENTIEDTCPICFMQEKNMKMVYIYKCKHTICLDCLYSIYWDYSFIKNIPILPIKSLQKKWISFLKTKKGCYIQYKLINKMLYNYYRDNESFNAEYNYYFNKININGINIKILKHLKELVHYQLKYKYFIYKNNNDKKIKELAINQCPYCKSMKLN